MPQTATVMEIVDVTAGDVLAKLCKLKIIATTVLT